MKQEKNLMERISLIFLRKMKLNPFYRKASDSRKFDGYFCRRVKIFLIISCLLLSSWTALYPANSVEVIVQRGTFNAVVGESKKYVIFQQGIELMVFDIMRRESIAYLNLCQGTDSVKVTFLTDDEFIFINCSVQNSHLESYNISRKRSRILLSHETLLANGIFGILDKPEVSGASIYVRCAFYDPQTKVYEQDICLSKSSGQSLQKLEKRGKGTVFQHIGSNVLLILDGSGKMTTRAMDSGTESAIPDLPPIMHIQATQSLVNGDAILTLTLRSDPKSTHRYILKHTGKAIKLNIPDADIANLIPVSNDEILIIRNASKWMLYRTDNGTSREIASIKKQFQIPENSATYYSALRSEILVLSGTQRLVALKYVDGDFRLSFETYLASSLTDHSEIEFGQRQNSLFFTTANTVNLWYPETNRTESLDTAISKQSYLHFWKLSKLTINGEVLAYNGPNVIVYHGTDIKSAAGKITVNNDGMACGKLMMLGQDDLLMWGRSMSPLRTHPTVGMLLPPNNLYLPCDGNLRIIGFVDGKQKETSEPLALSSTIKSMSFDLKSGNILLGHSNLAIEVINFQNKTKKLIKLSEFKENTGDWVNAVKQINSDIWVAGSLSGKIYKISSERTIEWKAHDHYVADLIEIANIGVLSSSFDKRIRLWDFEGNLIREYVNHKGPVTRISYDENSQKFYSIGHDGIITMWSLKSTSPVINFLPLRLGGSLAFIENSYFWQRGFSDGIERGLVYRKDTKSYGFEQFDLRYNRPDIVLERLNPKGQRSEEVTEKIARFKQYWEYRVRQNDFTTDQILKANEIHAPEVFGVKVNGVAVDHKDFTGDVSEKTIKVSFRIKDEDTSALKIKGYKIFVNGVPLYGQTMKRAEKLKRELTDTVEIELSSIADAGGQPGDNKIEISGFTEDGVESYREAVHVRYTGAKKVKPRLYIVSLGIDDYKGAEGFESLSYAVKDAKEIIETFQAAAPGKYDTPKILHYKNSEVDRSVIAKIRAELKQTTVDDTVIFFVSGHGVRADTDVATAKKLSDEFGLSYTMGDPAKDKGKNNIYYFMTSTSAAKRPWEKAIPMDGIRAALDQIPARQKLLLIDTCQSGEDPSLVSYSISEKRAKEFDEQLTRSETEAKKKGLKIARKGKFTRKGLVLAMAMAYDMKEMSEMFPELRRGTGTIEIAAAGGAQSALESGDWQNGAFTRAIKDFVTKEKSISVKALRAYVLEKVVELTAGAQTPMVARDIAGRDWLIGN